MTLDSSLYCAFCIPKPEEKSASVDMTKQLLNTLPIISRDSLFSIGNWQVEIVSLKLLTLAEVKRNGGLVSVYCGLLTNFKS